MGKRKTKRAATVQVEAPPVEQAGAFELADVLDTGSGNRRLGKAYRRVRQVEALERRGVITAQEAALLRHYRHHADIADRSPLKDSLNQVRGGSGSGPTAAYLNAASIANVYEHAAGSLFGLLRAVVVDDYSLSSVAMSRGGSIEDCRTVGGQRICTIRPRPKELAAVQLEMKMLARRLLAEEAA